VKAHHRHLAQLAARYRLTIVSARNGHLQLVDGDGRVVATASCTPRNPETALRNVERDLRHALGSITKGGEK
jgi:hypothetical protein